MLRAYQNSLEQTIQATQEQRLDFFKDHVAPEWAGDKVDRVKEAIAQGSFMANPEKIAEALISASQKAPEETLKAWTGEGNGGAQSQMRSFRSLSYHYIEVRKFWPDVDKNQKSPTCAPPAP